MTYYRGHFLYQNGHLLQADVGKLVRSRLVFGFKYLPVKEIGNGGIVPKSLSFNFYSLQKQLNKVKTFASLEVSFEDDYVNLLKQSFTVTAHHLKRCVSTQFRVDCCLQVIFMCVYEYKNLASCLNC